MKLYLIKQDVDSDYDTYDSAVVCAKSKEDAKTIHPNGSICTEIRGQFCSWVSIKDVTVECVGTAIQGLKRGVVVASYNAG